MSNPELTVQNVIQNYGYMITHFPTEPPIVPAAPYVGGVEWDATNYLASHIDLLNGIIACLPTSSERNATRELLRLSGWEKVLGSRMRTCKEKFYGGVHCGLRTWIAAGQADGWDVRDVRQGPSDDNHSPVKRSPAKKIGVVQPPPMMPKLDFEKKDDGGWL